MRRQTTRARRICPRDYKFGTSPMQRAVTDDRPASGFLKAQALPGPSTRRMLDPRTPSTVRLGQHLRYLDSIRGLSALYVAACHAWLMYAVQLADQGLRSTSGGLL